MSGGSEDSGVTEGDEREYTVVLRGPSAVIFPQDAKPAILIDRFPSRTGPLTLAYATRYIDRGSGLKTPGHIWVEAKGRGADINTFAEAAANTAISFLPLIALAGNAAVRTPTLELAYESSTGNHERDFLQAYLPLEGAQMREARELPPSSAMTVIKAIMQSGDAERLQRAAVQYQLALDNWHAGNEILVMAHLWMSTEALTQVIVKRLCRESAVRTRDELAATLGLTVRELDPYVRSSLIHANDQRSYAAIREASDGFEHGFGNYEDMRKRSQPAILPFGQNVRRAILLEAGITGADLELFLAAPFDTPLPDMPVVQYLRGKVSGPHDRLARSGSSYPFVAWKIKHKASPDASRAQASPTSEYTFSLELGEGVTFAPVRFEVWRP